MLDNFWKLSTKFLNNLAPADGHALPNLWRSRSLFAVSAGRRKYFMPRASHTAKSGHAGTRGRMAGPPEAREKPPPGSRYGQKE